MNLTLTGCKFGLESGRAFYSTYLSYAPSVCVFFSWVTQLQARGGKVVL